MNRLQREAQSLLALAQRRRALGHALLQQIIGLLQRCFGLLDLFDIGASAEPFQNLAVRPAHRRAADQPPAIDAIGTPQTAFQRVGFVVLRRTLPGIPGALLVIGVEGRVPAMAVTFLHRHPRVVHPLLIEIDVPTIGPGGPDDLRHGLRQGAKLLLAHAQGLLRPLAQRLLGPLALGDVGDQHAKLPLYRAESEGLEMPLERLGISVVPGWLTCQLHVAERGVLVEIYGLGVLIHGRPA